MKLLIKGGRVIDPSQGLDQEKEVLVEKGKVVSLLPPGEKVSGAKDVDAWGGWIVPGLIDMHVHLREPGEEYKETIASGASAAVAGGMTAVVCMANTKSVNDNASTTDYILEQARAAKKARVYPAGALSRGLEGEGLAEIGDLVGHGCVAVSDDGRPVHNPLLMRRALEYCLALEVPILDHAEVVELSEGGSMHEGHVSTELGLVGVPEAAESAMVARDLILAELTRSRLHIQHVSTAGSVRLIREAKSRGVQVTCETCPHYLALTHEALRTYDPNFKMNPPLRTEEDREALVQALADGTIDAIASDHAPHSMVEKEFEFDRAKNGIVGLETLLPITLELVNQGRISPARWVELVSVNPARILNLQGGSLAEGSVADITIIDPEQEWQVDKDKFYSRSKNTPFHGREVKGRATAVIIDGKVVKP